jgi:hypothetical protein
MVRAVIELAKLSAVRGQQEELAAAGPTIDDERSAA